MTTIDHQQAAVEAAAGEIAPHAYDKVLWRCTLADGRSMEQTASDAKDTAEAALTAAAPHLRAAWEQEMAEKIRAKFLGPDFGRNPVNGQDSPDAALHAAYDEGLQTALALLEGGAEDDSIVAEKSEPALPL